MPFANGENVGAYRVVEKLGQGGMATVFKAYHPALDRYVAIKVMHPALMGDPNFLARFQREARIVAKLDHPHIIPVYDFSQHRGHPYLVMRFVEGETLKARMQHGPLELQEVLRIARAVGGALTYAHKRGVLHRDIKPSNVLLTPDGGVYLTDFGLARMAEAGESTLSRDIMVGTPQYISPEQAKGLKDLDARTDIYSLGVVLYEMLVGRPPFAADTPYAVIHDHIFTPLPLPSELNADLPESAERALLKALAKEPDDRFQSVEELINALDAALKPALAPEAKPSPAETVVVSSETIVVPQPTPPPAAKAVKRPEAKPGIRKEKKRPKKKKRRWPWVMAGLAAFLFLIAIILGLVMINQRQQAGGVPLGTEQVEIPPGPEDVERLMEEAKAAGEEGNFGHALDLYQQAAEADPHLIPAYVGASQILIRMGKVDQALDALWKGMEANPENSTLHKRTAAIALLTERWDVAEKELTWLLEEMPEDALSHTYAAVFMLAQGRPCEEARPELDTALTLDPELAWTHYGLALCHLQEGNPDEARAELEFVLGQDETPPLLRMRAEKRLEILDQGVEGAIEREFEALLPLVGEIRDEDLQRPFKEMLDQARRAWESGDEEAAIGILKEVHRLVREQWWDELGEPLARELDSRLDHIIRLATEPGPP
ncbi:MAG: protein kinase [Anaerolineae bacterium]